MKIRFIVLLDIDTTYVDSVVLNKNQKKLTSIFGYDTITLKSK